MQNIGITHCHAELSYQKILPPDKSKVQAMLWWQRSNEVANPIKNYCWCIFRLSWVLHHRRVGFRWLVPAIYISGDEIVDSFMKGLARNECNTCLPKLCMPDIYASAWKERAGNERENTLLLYLCPVYFLGRNKGQSTETFGHPFVWNILHKQTNDLCHKGEPEKTRRISLTKTLGPMLYRQSPDTNGPRLSEIPVCIN